MLTRYFTWISITLQIFSFAFLAPVAISAIVAFFISVYHNLIKGVSMSDVSLLVAAIAGLSLLAMAIFFEVVETYRERGD